MARYTGPKTKIARKFGEPIYGADKNYEKRNYPPGQHGAAKRRKKVSEYGHHRNSCLFPTCSTSQHLHHQWINGYWTVVY